jgi:hypothetical protein
MYQAWSKPDIFQKSVSYQNLLFSLNTRYFPFFDHWYYATNSLKMGQAVLEWRCLIPDPFSVSTFDHALRVRPRLFFVGKVKAYQSGGAKKHILPANARLGMSKHTSLLIKSTNYICKKFYDKGSC